MRSFVVTDEVRDYAVNHGSWQPDDVVRQLQSETQALGDAAGMQIGDDQGQLLTMMTRLVDAAAPLRWVRSRATPACASPEG